MNILTKISILILSLASIFSANATPEKDREAFVKFFQNKFSDVEKQEFANGIYAIDAPSRAQWEEIEEFPPYELDIDEGEELYNKPFANGVTYSQCLNGKGREHFPYFDEARGEVITLELAINDCRISNGEKPLKYKKGDIVKLSAYIAYQARGKKVNTQVNSEKALQAYEAGKRFYHTKRGQLNFSCADCHIYGSGQNVRADRLSPGFGHTTHWPVYRSKWQATGTLHRRFSGCNNNIRSKPFKAQSKEYRNLEYFMSYMNNGLEFNGPGARK